MSSMLARRSGRHLRRGPQGVLKRGGIAGALALTIGSGVCLAQPVPATAAPVIVFTQTWQHVINDGTDTINLSSPNEADLPQGPAVVVGDLAGNVYAYNLANGSADWTYDAGAPVESTPSVAALTPGSPLDTVFVGSGDSQNENSGGYQAITPQGGDAWFTQETDPSTNSSQHYGIQASLAVGNLQGGIDVTAGSLGQNQDALDAANGAVLAGFPWFQADSNFSTPAIADLYGNGQTEIVEGGASSPGVAYGQTYSAGGHIRVLSSNGNAGQPEPNGGLDCEYNTNEEVDSSPAVGEFFGDSQTVGIVAGTGSYYNQSDSQKVIALNSHCDLAWEEPVNGYTGGSPALADVLGNGQIQVIEGTDTGTSGSVYALDGATGQPIWQTTVGRVVGSVVTADFGEGYQDVVAPTTNGVVILDGKTGDIVETLLSGAAMGFQNAPLITDDPDGSIGLTVAGYQGQSSVITHFEVPGSNGGLVSESGAWPEFHHDAQLTGDAGTAQTIEVPCNAPAGAPSGYYLSASDGGIFNFGNLPFCGSTGGITLNQPVVGMAATQDGGGYWEVAADGGIFAFGDAQFYGSTGGIHLNSPVVGMAATPNGKGYWLVAADGGVFAFGDAPFRGSTGNIHLNKPIVGMASTPDGNGYWLVASDGGIFSFGDAAFHGSTGNLVLNKPVVGMAATVDGNGYWLVASDGGIFSFGDAAFHGSTGNLVLNKPVVGMAATVDGNGYWLVASDGGIFSFGDAVFHGSTGNLVLDQPVVGMQATASGNGYRFVAADGGIFDFGDAQYFGSMGGKPLNKPVVAMAGF
jgi:outer membrane protein assembly factor BamB